MSDTVTITLDRGKAEAFVNPLGDSRPSAVGAILNASREIREQIRAALDTPDQPQVPSGPKRFDGPMHVLASTIGRLRLLPGPEESSAARRDLDDAAAAVGELRTLLAQRVPSGPLGDEERERLREFADKLDPPRGVPGPIPFKYEVDIANDLRKLADQPPTEEGLRERIDNADSPTARTVCRVKADGIRAALAAFPEQEER